MKPAIAFLISPLIASLLVPVAMGMLEGNIVFMPNLIVIVPVVYFFTVVVAVPTYIAMPKQHKKRLSSLVLASFVVAFAKRSPLPSRWGASGHFGVEFMSFAELNWSAR
jgi:hypothetical protein